MTGPQMWLATHMRQCKHPNNRSVYSNPQLHDISAVVKHLLTCTKHDMKRSSQDLLRCINIAKRDYQHRTAGKDCYRSSIGSAQHSVQAYKNSIYVSCEANGETVSWPTFRWELLTREYWSELLEMASSKYASNAVLFSGPGSNDLASQW